MLLNCGVGEDSWESLWLQGDPTSYPKGDQSWVFIGRTDVEAETAILWPLDVKNWLIWKGPDAGKDWRREEKGTTGWDGWMASQTRWTWVWTNPGRWWRTGKPGKSQIRFGDWTATTKSLNKTDFSTFELCVLFFQSTADGTEPWPNSKEEKQIGIWWAAWKSI